MEVSRSHQHDFNIELSKFYSSVIEADERIKEREEEKKEAKKTFREKM